MPGRCFLAFDLPDPALDLLARVREAFVADAPAWKGERWVRRELQHITVKFIGALDDASLPEAKEELGRIAAGFEPFELRLDGVRAVPSARRASMLWAELGGDVEASTELAGHIDATLAERFDVEAAGKPHRPHVTLVRARRPRRAPQEALQAGSAMLEAGKEEERAVSVPSVTLYASTLSQHGPTYEVLAGFRLGQGTSGAMHPR
jgi:RNA 2',3'-cyclic 3'-phosphodiesterase